MGVGVLSHWSEFGSRKRKIPLYVYTGLDLSLEGKLGVRLGMFMKYRGL